LYAAQTKMEELMQQLTEVPWRDVEVGKDYLVLNILNNTNIIQIREVELLGENTLFGTGMAAFVHAVSNMAYLVNDTPSRYDPDNKFYEVPDESLLQQIRDACERIGPARFQEQMEEIMQEVRVLVAPRVLNIYDAAHIGTLSLDNIHPKEDPITYEPFQYLEECVRLMKNNMFIFKQSSLQAHFNTGKSTNPLTNVNVTLEDVERFCYRGAYGIYS